MAKIHELGFELANMIAAGEVVNRPASAIKELCENSIDAGATRITVEIQNGGVLLMRVSDNGCGMDPEDLALCIRRHATSKIRSAKDIDAITTMGFRGEALAALSAVTEMRIISKTEDAEYGHMLTAEYGNVIDISERGAAKGTVIIAENLFMNMPARRKFLKRDYTEASAVADTVEKLAMSHPNIAFQFISDGITKFETSGNGRLDEVIFRVYGKDNAKNLLKVDGSYEGVRVSGYVGSPIVHKVNRAYQAIFVNKRCVQSPVVASSISNAFTSYIPSDRFPLAVLFIETNPLLVDVNVHPSKLEVKFANEPSVYSAVYHSCTEALADMDKMPSFPQKGSMPIPERDIPKKPSVSETPPPIAVNFDENGKEITSSLSKNQISFDSSNPDAMMPNKNNSDPEKDFVEFQPGINIPRPKKDLASPDVRDLIDNTSPENIALDTSMKRDPVEIVHYTYDAATGTYKVRHDKGENVKPYYDRKTTPTRIEREEQAKRELEEKEQAFMSARREFEASMGFDKLQPIPDRADHADNSANIANIDAADRPADPEDVISTEPNEYTDPSPAPDIPSDDTSLPKAPDYVTAERKPLPKEYFKEYLNLLPGNTPTFEERDGQYGEGVYAIYENGKNCYHRVIGELFHKYIILEVVSRSNDRKMLVIDKHAAHERMLYEKIKKGLEKAGSTAQLMLVPIEAQVGSECVDRLKTQRDNIESFGFRLEFCEKSVKIWSLPIGVDIDCAEDVLLTVLTSIENGLRSRTDLHKVFDKTLFTMACKAAVKGGRECDHFTVDAIARAVATDPHIRFCPHGRPVVYELSLHELDGIFKR